MFPWFRVPVLALLLFAFTSADAYATHFDFSVSPNPPNEGQEVVFSLLPSNATVDRVWWDLDGDGEYEERGRRREVRHTYTSPGPVTVRMRARSDDDEPYHTTTKTIQVNAKPAADFGLSPDTPYTTQAVTFNPQVTDPEGDPVTLSWSFGDGSASTETSPSHAYADPGTYSVVLTATDAHGAVTTATRSVTVEADPGPAPAFGYLPAEPLTGETVTFSSTSTPSHGAISGTDWDLDGDGDFDDASGQEVTWVFETAGDHLVQMRVTQSNGRQAVAFAHVEVAAPPPPPDPPPPPPDPPPPPPDPTPPPPDPPAGSGTPLETVPLTPAPRLVEMRPFPVVRIAGTVLRGGALVKVLSVRAPRGAQVRIRCSGRGCPARSVARTSTARVVRFRRFERRLKAGVTLKIFVRQPGKIGKYTRFLIRAGAPPARVDRCLVPGRKRPVRCA